MTPQQIEMALETIALVLEDLKKTQEKQQSTITAIEEVLAEHAMRETQRLGQEIEPDDIASILACRDMLDAQPVPEVDRVIWPEHTEQEPVAWMDADGNVSDNNDHKCFPIPLYTHPPQRTEQNFCSRCGKRTKDIHTCTPPRENT